MSEHDDIEELLRAVEAAEAAARATLPTPEEERAIIDAAEALAGGDAGVKGGGRRKSCSVRNFGSGDEERGINKIGYLNKNHSMQKNPKVGEPQPGPCCHGSRLRASV